MTTAVKTSDLVQAHRSPPPGMLFYDSLEDVRSDVGLLGYISVVERAWQEMNLDGVLFLDARPILYLKENSLPFSPRERIRLQRLFWNQGVANVLVLADPTSVYIYSGLTKPQEDRPNEDTQDDLLIEQPLTQAAYVRRIQTLYHDLATGHYYEKHQTYFNPDQAVDLWLLENLRDLRNALIKGDDRLETEEVHALIGRVLFLCYLLDREVVTLGEPDRGQTPTMLLARLLEKQSHEAAKNYLYELFLDLKTRFNGNMFDQDLEAERDLIKATHLHKLILFLGGHEVESGQRSLGFWPYNFKMIPVETISAIYEDFLTTEDPENQKGRGAFYTPRFLAEMVVDTAVRENPSLLDGSFLDPACGSGIFLVILFNRMANRWIYSHPDSQNYLTKAEALQGILERRIRGVDIEETACRIACFSLYLAYLDFFDPPDIRKHVELTGRSLPKLLDYGDDPNRPSADIPVILKAEFGGKKALTGKKFDCIIGNPPWKGRGNKQLALQFIKKAPGLLNEGGIGCLLLPTKILQNQTDAFQSEWLMHVTLELVLQLADYRFILFSNALCPAFIARFKNIPPNPTQHLIEFSAPKFHRDGLRQGFVTVNPSSRTWIPLSDIIAATQSKSAPVVWKRRLWGTSRDQKLIELLLALPSLRDHVDVISELQRKKERRRSKRWIAGQGIKPWPDESKEEPDRLLKNIDWPLNTPFIETRHWGSDFLLLPTDTITLEKRLKKKHYRTDVFYSQPHKDLFHPPAVLVSQGFGKVTYCDFVVLFQDSLQSIAGPKEDADLLRFLAAYLRSDLARYFQFHTSANWGTERPKVHLNELLRIPFPLPGNEFISPEAGEIVNQVSENLEKLRLKLEETLKHIQAKASHPTLFGQNEPEIRKEWPKARKELINALDNQMQPLIYHYFGLNEQEVILVEDTIRVFEPSSTPRTWRSPLTMTLDPLEKAKAEPYAGQGFKAYADTLTDTLNSWAKSEGSSYRVQAEGGADGQTGLAMVTIRLAKAAAPFRHQVIPRSFAEQLNQFHCLAGKGHGMLFYERDIFMFQGDRIHIIRPNILLNWTRTAALNDAERIYGEVVMAQEGI